MPKYVVAPHTGMIVPEGDRYAYAGGVRVVRSTTSSHNYFLQCCGFSALEGFDHRYGWDGWKDKAEYLSCIYRALYDKGTVMYVLSGIQLNNVLHQALLELGVQEVAQFPNRYYGTQMIHLFLFPVRNIAGHYCDRYGNAYASEEDVVPADVIPVQLGVGKDTKNVNYVGTFAKLPVPPQPVENSES